MARTYEIKLSYRSQSGKSQGLQCGQCGEQEISSVLELGKVKDGYVIVGEDFDLLVDRKQLGECQTGDEIVISNLDIPDVFEH